MRRLWQWFRAKRSKPLAAQRTPDDVLLTALEARIAPQDLPQVEMQLRDSFGLHFRSGYPASSPVGAPLRATELQQLAKNPKLAAVFVFHGDGYLREAALQSLASRLSHSVVAYGLFLRLNDWSEPVRNAAWKALDRCLAATPPEILAPAIWIILQNGRSWGRWQQGYFGFVTRIMQPPALREHLITQLLA